jgi:hypothetical protein
MPRWGKGGTGFFTAQGQPFQHGNLGRRPSAAGQALQRRPRLLCQPGLGRPAGQHFKHLPRCRCADVFEHLNGAQGL